MKITFLPKTNFGKWSVIITIAGWILFVVGSLIPSKPDYTGFDIITQNPMQSIITLLLLAAGLLAVIMGLISVIRKQERSILVFLAILSGLYNIFGFVGVIITVLSS
ncbi:MAG: hypothetical protein ACYCYI_13630 [Saccharofermentanales bacterium]